jgi:hypothetical protein
LKPLEKNNVDSKAANFKKQLVYFEIGVNGSLARPE